MVNKNGPFTNGPVQIVFMKKLLTSLSYYKLRHKNIKGETFFFQSAVKNKF